MYARRVHERDERGRLAAARRNTPTDVTIMGVTQLGIAVPNFWFGMLLVLLFGAMAAWALSD